MSSFSEKLHLKEQAEENMFFARRDRQLVEALRLRRSARSPLPAKVVSGGQTGVDRAALDAALRLGIAVGGWCPRGRRAEDGPIAERYPLRETPSADYRQRTEWNVRDADATLIIHRGRMTGGTRLTAEIAADYGRPLLCLDLADEPDAAAARCRLAALGAGTLNVAGPREEGAPGIYAAALELLCRLLAEEGGGPAPPGRASAE